MPITPREIARPDASPAGASIPMMAQVYARARHRLREVETLLQQPHVERRADGANDLQPERTVLEAQAAALRTIAEKALVVPISSRAIVGSTVHVRSAEDSPLERYEIVVSTEADPPGGKVSFDSPIGSALLGREVGDVAIVATPRGPRELRIVAIEHD